MMRLKLILVALALTLIIIAPALADMVWLRGAAGDPGSLDPHKATTQIESNVLAELFEGLVTRNARGELIAGVAESWSASEDGLVYTFQFRSGVRWSNGDPVTPDDFVYAFRRLMSPSTGAPYANILYTLKNGARVNRGELPVEALGVRALSGTSLEIALEQPAPYFVQQLAHFTAMPLHRASIEAFGADFVRPAHLVSNGPFILREFTPNERVVLVRNPLYYGAGQVALDREIFISLEDRSAALLRFMAGEIHSYDDVPAEQLAFVRRRLPDALKITPSLGIYYYAFDTRNPPFDDRRVRQALSMVIDRDFLAGRIWGGAMAPSVSFAPPDIPSYGAPAQAAWAAMTLFEREDEAKRLLAEAGYGAGGRKLDVEIRFNNSENHRATAVAVADMWRALGVETRLIGTDATSFYAFLREKSAFDVVRSSWLADFPDAENFLFLAESGNRGLNVPNFSSAAYDALMDEARKEPAPEKRAAVLHRAEALLLEESPYAVLMSYRSSNLVSPRLRGWEPNALADHYGRYVSVAPP